MSRGIDPTFPGRLPDSIQAIRTALGVLGGLAGVSRTLSATATLDFPSIAANTCQELTITVTDAVVGDAVKLGAPAALEANLTFSGFVSAANTVTIRVCNPTVGAINPASATWRATVVGF